MRQKLSDIINKSNFFTNEKPIIIRWIVALTMSSNDLSFCAHKINETQADYGKIYYFRLALAYIREIAKVIKEAAGYEEIESFISRLPKEARDNYLKITQFLSSYEDDSIVKKVLKVPRDELFHYPDVKGKLWTSLVNDIIALNRVSIEMRKDDRTILGVRYRFIDALVWKRVKEKLSKEIVDQLSSTTVDLISFVDYTFEHLVVKNANKNEI